MAGLISKPFLYAEMTDVVKVNDQLPLLWVQVLLSAPLTVNYKLMEKLIELLREYNMSNQSPYILGDADYYVDGGLYAPQIISKSR